MRRSIILGEDESCNGICLYYYLSFSHKMNLKLLAFWSWKHWISFFNPWEKILTYFVFITTRVDKKITTNINTSIKAKINIPHPLPLSWRDHTKWVQEPKWRTSMSLHSHKDKGNRDENIYIMYFDRNLLIDLKRF